MVLSNANGNPVENPFPRTGERNEKKRKFSQRKKVSKQTHPYEG